MPDVPFYLLLPMAWPYVISSRFNTPRSYPFAPRRLQLHEGIDFAPKQVMKETPYVRAAQRGIVDKIGWDAKGYGNYVRVVHDWGSERFVTWYGHLKEATVKENNFVNVGETIGVAGSTGNSTGLHVHLTLQHIGKGMKNYVVDDVIDPEHFFTNTIIPKDEVWWVADLSVPDGTVIKAGEKFRKTWRIRNVGTTVWQRGYELVSDGQMKSAATVALPAANPGEDVDVSVDLVAPTKGGPQRSTWEPRSITGEFFDTALYAEIEVQSEAEDGDDEARYVDDVTVPYDTSMKPGQTFRKTWSVRNTGRSKWGKGYQFVFVSGERMNGPEAVPLPPAMPGQESEISIDLVAPAKPGKALGTWQPRNPQGKLFDFPMRVEVVVIPSADFDNAAFVADVVVLQAGQSFVKTWRIQNSGQTRWGDGYVLAFIDGEQMGAPGAIPVVSTKGLMQTDVSVRLTAPPKAGLYIGQWQMRSPDGKFFGPVFEAEVEVRL